MGIGYFYTMLLEPLQDAPEEIALDRGDAVLRVVNPHPYFQVDGIISQAGYKVGRLGSLSTRRVSAAAANISSLAFSKSEP